MSSQSRAAEAVLDEEKEPVDPDLLIVFRGRSVAMPWVATNGAAGRISEQAPRRAAASPSPATSTGRPDAALSRSSSLGREPEAFGVGRPAEAVKLAESRRVEIDPAPPPFQRYGQPFLAGAQDPRRARRP